MYIPNCRESWLLTVELEEATSFNITHWLSYIIINMLHNFIHIFSSFLALLLRLL